MFAGNRCVDCAGRRLSGESGRADDLFTVLRRASRCNFAAHLGHDDHLDCGDPNHHRAPDIWPSARASLFESCRRARRTCRCRRWPSLALCRRRPFDRGFVWYRGLGHGDLGRHGSPRRQACLHDRGHRPSMVVANSISERPAVAHLRDRQRNPYSSGKAGPGEACQRRCHPLVLGSCACRQDGSDSRTNQCHMARGQQAGSLSRPVLRILWQAARAYGLDGSGKRPGSFSGLVEFAARAGTSARTASRGGGGDRLHPEMRHLPHRARHTSSWHRRPRP